MYVMAAYLQWCAYRKSGFWHRLNFFVTVLSFHCSCKVYSADMLENLHRKLVFWCSCCENKIFCFFLKVKSASDFHPKATSTMVADDSDTEDVDNVNLQQLQLNVSTVTFYWIIQSWLTEPLTKPPGMQPSHRLCKPAYLVPVPSQDK